MMTRLFVILVIGFLHFIFCVSVCPATEDSVLNFKQDRAIDLLGAVRRTMEMQPEILMQREAVKLSKGAYRANGGIFDWNVEIAVIHDEDWGPVEDDLELTYDKGETTYFNLQFSKLLRSGISFTPYIKYSGYRYNLTSGYNTDLINSGGLGLAIKLPLLQGRGYKNTGVDEIASSYEVKAAQFQLAYEMSDSVFNTVQAFWSYFAAFEQLSIKLEAQKRAANILDNTLSLVDAGETPSAELVNVKANLADKESATLTATQSVESAKAKLGLAMGISYEQIIELPKPAGSFPKLNEKIMAKSGTINDQVYIRIASGHRADLLAKAEQNKAYKARRDAARNNLKPALNLEFSMGYDGLEYGSSSSHTFNSVKYDQDNPDWSIGTRVTYPLGNNNAQGYLQQIQARYSQGELEEKELLRTIQSEITVTRNNLHIIAGELERSNSAVENYSTAVDNERDRYLMGETTLMDLLYIEDRRDSALLNQIAVQQKAAVTLANLQFVTGQLVRFVNEQGVVTLDQLTTLLLPE